jgi:hypothetical protein
LTAHRGESLKALSGMRSPGSAVPTSYHSSSQG